MTVISFAEDDGKMRAQAVAQRGAASKAIGASPAFQRLMGMVDLLAASNRPVLICGPSGSGKEIVAEMMHQMGSTPKAPFIDLNCGAIAANLVEAELFGHVKGAFTGATENRAGHFDLASNGTLFLDEIGELPLALQPKLLRVLETGTFRPLGSNQVRRFSGRIVAATHCDLPAMVQAGSFREDLYYRLAVLTLDVPGLDQRREDIPALVAHFAARQPRRLSFTPDALDRLSRHSWPGHVRELRNVVERLAVLSSAAVITGDGLDEFLPVAAPQAAQNNLAEALMRLDGEDKLAAAEQLLIDHALLTSAGNKTLAAQKLGVSRKVIERRMAARADKHGGAVHALEQGKQLVDSAQYRQAIEVLEKGVALLAALPFPNQYRRLRFDLHWLLVVSHRSVNGWLSMAARASYEAALTDARELGDERELTSLLFAFWTTQLMRLELVGARATAQEMLVRAQASGDADQSAQAHLALSNTLYWLGDSEEALACLTRGKLVDAGARDLGNSQGFDATGLALIFEGLAAFQLGKFVRARRAWEHLIARASDEQTHAFNRVVALQGAAWLACLFEDMERLAPLAYDLETISEENSYVFYRGVGMVFRGCHLMSLGRNDEAERAMADGFEKHMTSEGGQLFHSFQAWQRGRLLLQARRLAECELLVTLAIDAALAQQDRAYLCDLLEVRALAKQARGDQAGAEQELRNALATALALGAITARIGVATSLASLLADTGRGAEAIDILTRAVRPAERDLSVPRLARAVHMLEKLGSAGFGVTSN